MGVGVAWIAQVNPVVVAPGPLVSLTGERLVGTGLVGKRDHRLLDDELGVVGMVAHLLDPHGGPATVVVGVAILYAGDSFSAMASARRFRSPHIRQEAMTAQVLAAQDFVNPAILLSGQVDYAMYESFRQQLAAAPKNGLVVVELSTLGGDPEVARMMGEDVRFHSDLSPDRRFAFLGKAAIYSAGTTLMSFFATENRYLTRGTRLMVHERKLSKQLAIDGPLTTCIATVKATLHEIEASIAIQNEGFENLIVGSSVTMDELLEKAPANWYIEATEAQQRGLVAAVI